MTFEENENLNGQEPVYGGQEQSPAAPEEQPGAQSQDTGASRVPPVQSYMDQRESWRDPSYEAASSGEGVYSPGRYAYGTQSWQQPAQTPEKPKKPKKKHGFLKAACLVLVCALVSGLCSWAVVDYMLDHSQPTGGGKQVVINQASPISGSQSDIPTRDPDGGSLTGNQIYELGRKQVVGVNTSLTTNIFGQVSAASVSGSGFIISEDGYILTNYHVISYAVVYGGDLTVLMEDGTKYPAQVVGYMDSNDVAVIKIDATGLSPVTLGDSDKMLVGEWVYAIGNPLGELEYTMTPGIVSARDRVITTNDDITGNATSINMFQISAAVNHGNSGGPVYNARGEVIGIVTAKYADAEEGIESLGFAIPINDAINIATQLIETGYVAGAGLGIQGTDTDQLYRPFAIETYNIPSGCCVTTVDPGSAAEAAGLKVGDIITAFGDKPVTSMSDLKLALRRYAPGDVEKMTVYRLGANLTGETLELTVTLQERVEETTPDQQQNNQNQGGSTNPLWPWWN